MSVLDGEIKSLYQKKYDDAIALVLQQKESVFFNKFDHVMANNHDSHLFYKTGTVDSEFLENKFEKIDPAEHNFEVRIAYPRTVLAHREFSSLDQMRMVLDPTNPVMQSMVAEINRKIDDIIINDGIFGTVNTLNNGVASTIAYSAEDNVIEKDYNTGSLFTGDSGLHQHKINKGLQILQENFALDQLQAPVLAAPSKQLMGLRGVIMESDPLMARQVPLIHSVGADKALGGVLGLDFVHSERLGLTDESDQRALLMSRDAVKIAVWKMPTARIEILPGYKEEQVISLQLRATIGAVRFEAGGLVEIECDPTPTYTLA